MLNLSTSKTFSQMFYFRYFTSRKIIKKLMINNETRTNPSILITKFQYYDILKELLIYLTIKQYQELLEKINFCENLPKRVV